MKIVRDGKDYELTSEEVYAAYLEQEHIYDVDDVRSELELIIEDDMDEEAYIEAAKRIYNDPVKLDEVARAKRKCIDKYNMEWGYAVSESVKDAICEEMGNEHL